MIKILNASRELSAVEQYLMTISPAIESVKDVEDGTHIMVSAMLDFIDVKDDGEETHILSILTPEKKAYACQSQTFKRSLSDIANIVTDSTELETFGIIKTSGVTKAGRDFINCILDVDTIK